ncbi:hypothetical protein GCM10022211_18250 [Sphingomonas humi]|uniref:Uncharacterized protein n=1 Tax=Sphingomonas humi TaxID=335630 RepID=A0ABP7S3V5_9SPHN
MPVSRLQKAVLARGTVEQEPRVGRAVRSRRMIDGERLHRNVRLRPGDTGNKGGGDQRHTASELHKNAHQLLP